MAEEKKFSGQDMDAVRFFSLVSMFVTSAYQSMGKIANPLTGKVERNLDGAQGMIDILIMLKKKTAGNLTEDEERLLTSSITDLQLNFVKEKEKPEPKAEDKGEKKEEKNEETGKVEVDKKGPDEGEKKEKSGEKPQEKQKETETKKDSEKSEGK